MEARRRRQHRSCDQCRKGKRGCDAAIPEELRGITGASRSSRNANLNGHTGPDVSAPSPCSNCKKWEKECTFNWLYSAQTAPRERRRKKARETTSSKQEDAEMASINSSTSHPQSVYSMLFSPQSLTDSSESGVFPFHASDQPPSLPLGQDWIIPDFLGDGNPGFNTFGTVPPETQVPHIPPAEDIDGTLDCREILSSLMSSSFEDTATAPPQLYNSSPGLNGLNFSSINFDFPENYEYPPRFLSGSNSTQARNPHAPSMKDGDRLCFSSHNLTEEFARSMMTQNLFRIYHDSMENALSCWLTEQNCPYSGMVTPRSPKKNPLLNAVEKEWGPNWSNRICTRVCRLDRAYATVRGRNLTVTEEKIASRALLTTIMAFASQWTHHSQQRAGTFRALSSALGTAGQSAVDGSGLGDAGDSNLDQLGAPPPSVTGSERSTQENLWNQARHALNSAVGIPSFRIVFANIIFSLTQRPLDIGKHIRRMDSRTGRSYDGRDRGHVQSSTDAPRESAFTELHDLFDNDCAPLFLETALRQLFSFRYKLTRSQRQKPKPSRGTETESTEWHLYDIPSSSNIQYRWKSVRGSREADPNLLTPEDHETFNLLFWLGVMFDTLTAAVHQRPPVVSDEDSEIACVAPLSQSQVAENGGEINLDGWNPMPGRVGKEKHDLWGDLFLRKSAAGQGSNVPRWPCSYKEAAETLSDAAPVKVLLFRRVTRLQTLIYRGVGPECLEEGIQDTFWVYQHWNCTYKRFILDCIVNHDSLPPRIQSWYVILAGHWHLAAMLLADTLESIDRARIGLDSQRESRRAMDLVPTLRRENALAVSNLAQCSLHGQDPSFAKARQFHDSVNEGAFLTEPWTVILIRSFTTAGYILLDEIDMSPHAVHLAQNDPSEHLRRQCGFCIDALWCLGRKSDMAFLAARALSNGLDERLRERITRNHVVIPEYLADDCIGTVPVGYDYAVPISSTGSLF